MSIVKGGGSIASPGAGPPGGAGGSVYAAIIFFG